MRTGILVACAPKPATTTDIPQTDANVCLSPGLQSRCTRWRAQGILRACATPTGAAPPSPAVPTALHDVPRQRTGAASISLDRSPFARGHHTRICMTIIM
jgi:hypothetical protein